MAYRKSPTPPPLKGPCTGCRYLLGDYCSEDGMVVAPGASERFKPKLTIGDLLRRLRGATQSAVGVQPCDFAYPVLRRA